MAPPPTHIHRYHPKRRGRIKLAIHGIKKNQFSSQREAARVWKNFSYSGTKALTRLTLKEGSHAKKSLKAN
jgi:hypothetical protein